MFYLERFIKAQDRGDSYEQALEEIREGRKRSHWIWYVFPQVSGLGNSEMSLRYSIDSLLEANAFMEDPVLSERLIEAATTVENVSSQQCYSMEEIFGDLDAQKVMSCMTLFDYVAPDSIFQRVLRNCFHDSYCQFTRDKLDPQYEWIRVSAFKKHGLIIDQKAMFESGSFESGKYTKKQRLGTLIDLFLRDERMDQMVQHYLWSRDCSIDRVDGVESTLKNYISIFLSDLVSQTKDQSHSNALFMYRMRLEGIDDVLIAADEFDTIFSEVTKNLDWKGVVDEYVGESLLIKKR